MPRARVKDALIIATALAVLCPHCGAEQPDPEAGSDIWEPRQLERLNGSKRKCVSCDEPIRVHFCRRVTVSGWESSIGPSTVEG